MAIGTDNFTDSDGVLLEDHTPDTGSGWSVSTTGRLKITANELGKPNGGGPGFARKGDDLTQDDVQVQADCETTGSSANLHSQVGCRMGNANFDGFFGGIEGSDSTARAVIYKVVGGTVTLIVDTGIDSRALNTKFTYRLEAKNNGANTDLELFENETSILTHTESTDPFQGTGTRRCGIRQRKTAAIDTW